MDKIKMARVKAAAGDRLTLGMTAPPQGLTLVEVRYPAEAFTNPAALRWHEEPTAPKVGEEELE